MSDSQSDSRREGRGGSGGDTGGKTHKESAQFSPGGPHPQAVVPAEAYGNFYYNAAAAAGFSPFSGDIRDSIAAIWSRTSPSGAAGEAAFTHGAYAGQFATATPDNSSTAGQFAANLTGHFATSELGMFGGAGNSDYYGHAYGYGPQYTQWPESGAGAAAAAAAAAAGPAGRGGTYSSYMDEQPRRGGDRGLADAQQGLESMKLNSRNETNGYGAPKKMSWASVASQPAKPQPAPAKAKKPGVLAPPTIIPSSKPPVTNMTAPPPVPLPVPNGVVPDLMKGGDAMGMPPMVPPPHHMEPPPMSGPPPPYHHHPMSMPPATMMPPYHGGQNGPIQTGGPPPRAARVANGTGHMADGGVNNNAEESVRHPVLESLKSSNDYNPRSFDLNPKNARFFVIKSFSEDDIHRSIKYEIWCSTDHGNKRLDAAFRERNGQGPIFLLFSVNGSGHFCGMAEMLSPVDYANNGSTVWVQDKFKGQFKVKWIYVKDVPNVQLRHIRLENNENKPVTNSRDTQEVPPDKGKMVLKIIHSFNHLTAILDDFVYYEKRQKEEEGKKAAANIPGMNDRHESRRHQDDGGRHHRNNDGGHHRSHYRDHHGHHKGGHDSADGPPPPHHRGEGRRGKPRP